MTKYLDQNGLAYFWTKIKAWLSSHAPVKYFGYNWNVDTNDDYALVVGNGADENNPNDSFAIKHDGDIVIGDGSSSSNESAIWYKSEHRNAKAIRFLSNHVDGYSDGVIIGDGGLVVLGSGESAGNYYANESLEPDDEVTYITSDSWIGFVTNCDTYQNKQLSWLEDGRFNTCGTKERGWNNTGNVVNDSGYVIKDVNDETVGSLMGRYVNGAYGMLLSTVCKTGNKYNGIGLLFDQSNNRVVEVTEQAPWRKALGLGQADGAFPLTLAQGGSGMTRQQYITNINTILTAAPGITVTDVAFERWGQICTLRVIFKKNAAISIAANGDCTDFEVATIKTGYRPDVYIYATGCYSGEHAKCIMNSDGKIVCTAFEGIGSARSIAANTTIATYGVYMLWYA